MIPKNKDLKTWLLLELLNHPVFDEMLDTVKNGRIKCKCEACDL